MERATVTLRLRRDQCVVTDDEVLYSLDVETWRAWLPSFVAAVEGLDGVEELEVRGAG